MRGNTTDKGDLWVELSRAEIERLGNEALSGSIAIRYHDKETDSIETRDSALEIRKGKVKENAVLVHSPPEGEFRYAERISITISDEAYRLLTEDMIVRQTNGFSNIELLPENYDDL